MEDFFEGSRTNDDNVDFMKYIRGILRRWWVVLAGLGLIGAPWYAYLKSLPPEYKADAWLSFENSGSVSDNLIESRMAKLRSRSFAEEVTSELGLALTLINKGKTPLYRQDVFKTFSTTKEPVPGWYSFHFYANGWASLWSETRMLDSVRVERFVQDTTSTCGFSFSLNPEVIRKQTKVVFQMNDFQRTVKSLQSRIAIVPQGRTLMQITLTDTDPFLAAETINMLAIKFVNKSIEIAKRASQFNRKYLGEQLAVVQSELNDTDAQLRNFRKDHITNLDQESQAAVTQMNQVGDRIDAYNSQKKDIGQLILRLDPTRAGYESGISIRYVYEQIMDMGIFQNDLEMSVVKKEWANKYGELNRMGNMPARNERVQQLNEDIVELQTKVHTLARQKIVFIDDHIDSLRTLETSLQKTLGDIPQEELNFMRLDRQRRANEKIYEELNKNYKEAQILEAVDSENISVYDRAIPPTNPISADKRKKMAAGLMFGLFFGVCSALIWEVADKSIRSRDDIKRYLKLPILGVIPKVKFDAFEMQDSEKAKSISSQIVTHDYSPTPVGEAYRSLRTSILFSKMFGPVKSLVVSSVAPGEGKSFTAANLAITLAQQKTKALLIDADFRRGVLHNSFNCPKKPGLTNYLTGVASLDAVLNETYIPNLSLITCGSMIPNPSELLGSEKMQKFIEGITHRFDFVIFDTPPLLAASDAVILGTLVDGVGLVVRAGMTKRDDVQRKMELFQNVHAKVIGVILNCAGVEVAHEGYSYYAY
jgi:polysaccharide biosynthesis transport protein